MRSVRPASVAVGRQRANGDDEQSLDHSVRPVLKTLAAAVD